MSDRISEIKPGEGRCPGLSYADLLAQETRPIPPALAEESYNYRGSDPLETARYTSPEFFQKEVTKMWPHVWQYAARDEDMPSPGDYVIYENVGRSYLVIRQDDGSVKAMHNVCLHRGRKLRTESGDAEELRCPFHGFTWRKDGSFKTMPCSWDFPHLKAENMALPQAEVANWGGYIFIREEPGGPTIEEYLAPIPEFFKRWDHESCTTVAWVGKVIHANWKATMEAFIEAWHVIEAHPQLMPFTGDANTRYNIYGDHVNVAITPFATPSPHLDASTLTEQWVGEKLVEYNARTGDPLLDLVVKPGETAREAVANMQREYFTELCDYDYSNSTDSEMVDAFTYNVFPNFAPWGGHMPAIVYRWRPWPDHTKTLMEVRVIKRAAKGDAPQRSMPMRFLTEEETFMSAEDLGRLGDVLDQDLLNLPYVQTGMEVSKTGKLQLGNYQEIRIRQFHQTLDKYLAR